MASIDSSDDSFALSSNPIARRSRYAIPDPVRLPNVRDFDDLSGKTIGAFSVLYYAGLRTGRHLWVVQCKCGRKCAKNSRFLKDGVPEGCGRSGCCINAVDLTSQTLKGWKVIERDGSDKENRACWLCRCVDCEGVRRIPGAWLREGGRGVKCHNKSCGGLHRGALNAGGTMNCNLCERALPFDKEHFRPNPTAKCGISRTCRECARKRNAKNAAEQRLKVLRHYSGGHLHCECCRESHQEFLTIDHVNGDGAEHRRQVKSSDICPWIIRNGFPEGFRVLCMNCNYALGLYGYCPHAPLTMRQSRTRRVAKEWWQ
jgi:hypothetical protein